MRTIMLNCLFVVMLSIVTGITLPQPSLAISPEEQLADEKLEERARGLSKQLRCLVCQNQSIDDSDADLAKDLRIEVRNLIVEGKSDTDILEDLRLRYGDYVLLNPPVNQATYLLWLAPVFIVLMGVALFFIYRRSSGSTVISATPETADTQKADSTHSASSPLIITGLGVVIVIVATALYSQFGRPDLPAQPLVNRSEEIAAAQAMDNEKQQQLRRALTQAEQAAREAPENVDSWLNLAMRAAQAEQSEIEINALERALELTGGHNAIKSMLAEALARQADGLVTLPVRELIAQVLQTNPQEPRALYLSGLAAFQDEAYEEAVSRWIKLLQISTPDAPWHALVTENIAQAAQAGGFAPPELPQTAQTAAQPPAPVLSEEQIAEMQSLSSEEQNELIRSMVDRLEARLEENPSDLAGWQRLITARDQLGDTDGMVRALQGAAGADADNPSAYLAIVEFILSQGQSMAYLNEAEQALNALAQLRPDSLEVLFFTGHFAQLKQDKALAISSWRTLADRLEPDSPLREQLEGQIKALSDTEN